MQINIKLYSILTQEYSFAWKQSFSTQNRSFNPNQYRILAKFETNRSTNKQALYFHILFTTVPSKSLYDKKMRYPNYHYMQMSLFNYVYIVSFLFDYSSNIVLLFFVANPPPPPSLLPILFEIFKFCCKLYFQPQFCLFKVLMSVKVRKR